MSMKKILLSSLLLYGSMLPVQEKEIIDYFFCDIPKLRALEMQKLETLAKIGMKATELSEQEELELEMEAKALLVRLVQLSQKYADLGEKIENDSDVKEIKSLLVQFSNRVQQDPKLTNLVKNILAFGCKHMSLIAGTIASSPYYAKFKSGDISDHEIIAVFAEYIPKNMDLVQISMEYTVWNHAYLKKQLNAKKAITIDDLCYSMQQLGVIAKLPKKSQELWSDLVIAIQKGAKDLPQDLRENMLKNVEISLRKPELEIGMKLLESLTKLRAELIATRCSDQGKLLGYSKLLDQVIAQIDKAQKQKTVSENHMLALVKIAERLIFKN